MSKLLLDDTQLEHKIGSFLRKKNLLLRNRNIRGVQSITYINGDKAFIQV